MIPKTKVPAVLAATAFLLLRNRLSERIWGCHGVNTIPVEMLPLSPHFSIRQIPSHTRVSEFRRVMNGSQEVRLHPGHSLSSSNILIGIGILGDSLSDEYRFYAPDRVTARNWVEILAATRGLHFGEPRPTSRGTSKDRPFAYNWSQSGATTSTLLTGGQHKGLADQVSGGAAIGLAAMTIGSNDFANVLQTTRSIDAMRTALDQASANFASILDHLLAIKPAINLAVFTAVDLLASPILRGAREAGLLSMALTDAYQNAIDDFNDRLHKYIANFSHRIAVVDINQLLKDVVSARPYVVGNIELDGINPGNEAKHLFLSDGFHPGTIGQCLIANRFLTAINTKFHTGIPILDDQEIVNIASSVTKPSVSSLISTGILALFGYGRRRLSAA